MMTTPAQTITENLDRLLIPSDAEGVIVIEAPEGVLNDVEKAKEFLARFQVEMATHCPGVKVMLLRYGVKIARAPELVEDMIG